MPIKLFGSAKRPAYERSRGKRISKAGLCDYSSRDTREATAAFLFDWAARERDGQAAYWERMRRYYDGEHDTAGMLGDLLGTLDIAWTPAQSTDGFVHVEGQIDTDIPDFELSGRGPEDEEKAAVRERLVRYVMDRCDMDILNTRNERRLGIYGSAAWKLAWSAGASNSDGEVIVTNPSVWELYPDPTATDLDSCEFVAHTYKLHRTRAARLFGADVARMGEDVREFLDGCAASGGGDKFGRARWFSQPGVLDSETFDDDEQCVRVTEWWFRQPEAGECDVEILPGAAEARGETVHYAWQAGDIGLMILLGEREVRYVPKYWLRTGCAMYPFALYCKTPNDAKIWGRSELEPITRLIDASDREMAFAQLNSAFNANDIVVAEENAFADGCVPDNRPGAVWKLRPGMMGKVARLGNTAYTEGGLMGNVQRWRSMMQDTTGNYDVYQGSEPTKITTATGIALLNERAKSRMDKKNVDRVAGFRRLYALADYMALENFSRGQMQAILGRDGAAMLEQVKLDGGYVPAVDIRIHVGGGLKNSKAFTVSALSDLIRTPMTPQNYPIVRAFIETIELPMRGEIVDALDREFGKPAAGGEGTS